MAKNGNSTNIFRKNAIVWFSIKKANGAPGPTAVTWQHR